ncbi:MAG: hypothetical protein SNJ74_00740 [Fimbriimonadaceae bacterium]
MSSPLEPPEFDRQIREWARRLPSVSLREQHAWRKDLLGVIARLPYVASMRPVDEPAAPYHVDIRVVIDLPAGNLEAVWADLAQLWSDEVAHGLRAIHTFVRFPEGFDLKMACATGTNCSFVAVFRVTVRRR